MIEALLHGKLSRDQENMEDTLTSNVFGLIKYVEPEQALFSFLAGAQDLSRSKPLTFLQQASCDFINYEFWPRWSEADCYGCEPDVVIRVHLKGDRRLVILIEAKYHSGKSSVADQELERPNDQLAREWDNLVHLAQRERAQPILIYLTAVVHLCHILRSGG